MILKRILQVFDSKWMSLLCLLMSVLAIVMVFASLDKNEIYTFTWTDNLYLPSIWKDVMIDGTGFSGWHLNGAPNFFPDMLLYFIIRPFTTNWLIALVAFSITQSIIVITLSYLVVKNFIHGISPIFLNMGILFMLLIFYSKISGGFFYHTFLFLSLTYHMGSYIMFLLSFLLLGKYLKNYEVRWMIIMLLSVIVGVFNDRLYIFQFVFPSLALIVFVKVKAMQKKIFFFYFGILIAVFLGITIFNLINLSKTFDIINVNDKFLSYDKITSSFKILIKTYTGLFTRWWVYKTVGILVLSSILFLIINIVSGLKQLSSATSPEKITELAYCILALSFSVCIFFSTAIMGNYVGIAHDRYNVYFIFFNLFNWAFIFYKINYWLKKSIFLKSIYIGFLVFNIVVLFIYVTKIDTLKGVNKFVTYYPEKVKGYDELAEKFNLKYGLADYRNAKYSTLFSKTDLRIYHVLSDLRIWHHVTNEHWYYDGGKGKYANPTFNFIIPEFLNDSILAQKFNGHILDTISTQSNEFKIIRTHPFKLQKGKDKFFFIGDETISTDKN